MSKTLSEQLVIEGLVVEVKFTYSSAYRAPRDSYGQAESPDEPEEIEIKAVIFAGTDILPLMSEDAVANLERKLWEGREKDDELE